MKFSKCQNKGANVDNATIADTVVAGPAEYRATVESLGKEANTVKKSLEGKEYLEIAGPAVRTVRAWSNRRLFCAGSGGIAL